MKRLSLVDALFLYMETPETPMHVASVTIFKPTSPRDDLFGARRSSGGLDPGHSRKSTSAFVPCSICRH